MTRVMLCLLLGVLSFPVLARPSLPECSLPKLGNQLPQQVLDTLLAIQSSIPHQYSAEKDISALAYQKGFFTRVQGCNQPGVNLKADKTGYILTLAINNFDQCVAIERSKLFAARGIRVEITHLPRPQEKRCLKNPISGFFLGVVPHANQATFYVPVAKPLPTPAPSPPPAGNEKECKEYTKSKYQKLSKQVDQSLELIRKHTSESRRQLAAFEKRGGKFYICDTLPSGTGYYDVFDIIRLIVDQESPRKFESFVRMMLEEIAHSDRVQSGWPHPKEYGTQKQFASVNRDHLLNSEAEGWIYAWFGASEINAGTQYSIPMMATLNTKCRDDVKPRNEISVATHIGRLRKHTLEDGWQGQQQKEFTAKYCVKIAFAAPAKTYAQYYYDMSKDIYDAYKKGSNFTVVRGRPMLKN
ncbi:MAG: hypothetical protein VYA55_04200 [Pseudomonadota bacterium]|nr:hypothetical protein [Pseudomonadota bacterium]